MNGLIDKIKDYAVKNNVPIMNDDGIEFLTDYIKKNNVKRILEVGTAIGYSAIMMCNVSDDITVTTIERDKVRYDEAVKNVDSFNYNNRINLIFGDALDVEIEGKYDLIFIDAAKGQYVKYLNLALKLCKKGSVIIADNVLFKGRVLSDYNEHKHRTAVNRLREYLKEIEESEILQTSVFYVGDGVAISVVKG